MIAYDSPEFWVAVRGEWVAIDENGNICLYEQEPKLCGNVWWGPGSKWVDCGVLDFDPSSFPRWRESLRTRPYVWRQPDKNTPKGSKVWSRPHGGATWTRSHYAGVSVTGAPIVWSDGKTEWTAGPDGWWYAAHVVLADPTNPDRAPSVAWKPT
jgi:hypothetical protein